MSNSKVKDCKIRQADFVVGARVTQTSAGIKIDHELLADKLLEDFKMQDCTPVDTPFPYKALITKDDCCTEEAAKTEGYVKKYKSGVATVLYLSGTSRPDLAKFASELGKVQHRPGKKHMAVLKNVIRFIKGTKSYGIRHISKKQI